jgi:membrane protein
MEDKRVISKKTLSRYLPDYFFITLQTFKQAFFELLRHDPLLLGSSVAFFTVFSLPPILIILINVLSIAFEGVGIGEKLFIYLNNTFGPHTAGQIIKTIENINELRKGVYATIIGAIILVFIGTTAFSIIHKALNQIWQVKEKPRNNLLYFLKDRAVALFIIFLSGLLFLLSLLSDILITLFKQYTDSEFPSIVTVLNQVFSIAIVTLWFAIIFKFLPSVKLKWQIVWVGAIVTGLLFSTGKYVLGEILMNRNIATIYGAAGSIVLLLLFLFYSSLMLFYGASFMKVYAARMHFKVEPSHHSVSYQVNETPDEGKE